MFLKQWWSMESRLWMYQLHPGHYLFIRLQPQFFHGHTRLTSAGGQYCLVRSSIASIVNHIHDSHLKQVSKNSLIKASISHHMIKTYHALPYLANTQSIIFSWWGRAWFKLV